MYATVKFVDYTKSWVYNRWGILSLYIRTSKSNPIVFGRGTIDLL